MNICIIGAGASGLMAAISAAIHGNEGARITVFEKNDAAGKKLRITGNGKCNLSNTEFNTGYYYSDATDILEGVFSGFKPEDTLSFFSGKGLLLKCMNGSGVYPVSEQAASVVTLLKAEVKRLGISIVSGVLVDDILKKGDSYRLKLTPLIKDADISGVKNNSYDRVILACGTGAGITGREKDLINTDRIISSLGIPNTAFKGVLNGILCSEPVFKELKGVRTKGRVRINFDEASGMSFDSLSAIGFGPDVGIIREENSTKLYSDGEIQFTEGGLSGICVFQLSRFIARCEGVLRGSIDLLSENMLYLGSEIRGDDIHPEELLIRRKSELKNETILNYLSVLVNKKLAQAVLKMAGIPLGRELSYLRDDEIIKVYSLLREFPFTVKGLRNRENAQVWSGGISLGALSPELEVKGMPGLYACGEMVNVDGPCGGYNLQWAWSSGYIAGKAAAIECI